MKAYTCTCILNIMFEQVKYWNLLLKLIQCHAIIHSYRIKL